jgi:drug/metabolite transporter (DMT)-like permease
MMSVLRTPSRRLVGVLAALFAVTVWAGWLPITRLGVLSALAPADVGALRYGTSGLLLLPVLLARWREVPWQRPIPIIIACAGAGMPYFFVFAVGLRLAKSGQGAVLGPGSVSAFATLILWALFRERPDRYQLLGLAVTLCGSFGILFHDVVSGGAHLEGFALIVLGSLCWASFTVASRFTGMRPLVNAAVVSVVNASLFVPLYLMFGGFSHLAAAPWHTLLLQAGYQGALTGVVALVSFSYAIDRIGPAAAARFMPLVPVLAAIIGWRLLGDTIDAATAIGLCAVAGGVLIATRVFGLWPSTR